MKRKEKKEFKVKKKAMAIGTVIALIILLIGFLILLFVIYELGWFGEVNREVCHQSVVYRATLPSIGGAKGFVPLKCKTDKVCITAGIIGGKCPEYINTPGVTYIKVNDAEEVEQVIAKELLSCWEMMGEGKLTLFSSWMIESYGFGSIASSCIICSRVAFDKETLKKKNIDLNKVNVFNYMMTHKVPGKDVSYYVYMSAKGGKMSVKDNRKENLQLDSVEDGKRDSVSVSFDEEGANEDPGKELSVMFMQVTSPKYGDVLKTDLYTVIGIAGAGTFAIGPKFAGKAVTTVAKSPWGIAITAVALLIGGVYQYKSVSDNQAMTAGYCGDISIGDEASYGCSVVRTVNYGAEDLKQYCSVIESIP
ncbi:MAG: hypothetical protein Q8N99_04135 [Nanoarchaeota archaeon]|nr:hypothetical protein [Nanoarchaeota archaeon]